ncbi:MAG: ATP synthase F1 subunit gamma [Alphaproteobacteria bacterium]|nr:MAG: ATP synthase F1 subunit gamma [Alphaproteobacteria bacterium]
MPSLKALRSRIKSVKNTRQITKTMKMVAAAKVRRARLAVEGARPYASKLNGILSGIAGSADASAPLLLTGREQVKTVVLAVCGSDRGLCGGLNSNLLKAAFKWIESREAAGQTVKLIAVGRKIEAGLKSTHGEKLIASYTDMGRNVEFAHAQTIAQAALAGFNSGEYDEVHLLSAQMVSMLAQTPVVTQLIPFAKSQTVAAAPQNYTEFEPSEDVVLEHLLPLNLNMQVFTALLETSASEQAARMTAMDNATRNAGEMIKRLSVQYNRSRQASITKELIEIISGAEAL